MEGGEMMKPPADYVIPTQCPHNDRRGLGACWSRKAGHRQQTLRYGRAESLSGDLGT